MYVRTCHYYFYAHYKIANIHKINDVRVYFGDSQLRGVNELMSSKNSSSLPAVVSTVYVFQCLYFGIIYITYVC